MTVMAVSIVTHSFTVCPLAQCYNVREEKQHLQDLMI